MTHENWKSSDSYELFMGRWSRIVADAYIDWLNQPTNLLWLDVGCGTGALSQMIASKTQPKQLFGADLSADFATHANNTIADGDFLACDAQKLPFPDDTFDVVVSGIALNFVPNPQQAVEDMKRITKQGGIVSVYVWDYVGKMEFLRYFWDAALEIDDSAKDFDEGLRFPLCQPEVLKQVFQDAGLQDVEVSPIDATTIFRDFEDYWQPFTLGNFPAPKYAMSLVEDKRLQLRELLRQQLPTDGNGQIQLIARVWAVRGKV